jgi:hypothetical protein
VTRVWRQLAVPLVGAAAAAGVTQRLEIHAVEILGAILEEGC